nr:hypothetical protein [Burkholderia sp. BCC1993]
MSKDPIGLADGINGYVYGPNPVGWTHLVLPRVACIVAFPLATQQLRMRRKGSFARQTLKETLLLSNTRKGGLPVKASMYLGRRIKI